MAPSRNLRAGRAGLLGLLAAGLFASCVPESEQVQDSNLPTSDCGQRERIDGQVKQLAASDFASAGKPCQPYDMQLSTTNPQETLWRVCCGDTAFTYIYFPQKCVVRRSAGPFACK
jgi:hypothetical protein